jgi:hypothetical protein
MDERSENQHERSETTTIERSENLFPRPPKGGRDSSSEARWRRRLGRPKGVSSEVVEGRARIRGVAGENERSENQHEAVLRRPRRIERERE